MPPRLSVLIPKDRLPMQSEDLVQSVVRAFAQSDVGPLLAAIDDNIVWHSATEMTAPPFRFGGIHRGRAGVIELVSRLATVVTFLRFAPKEIVTSGDVVWGLFDTAFVPVGKQQTVEYLTAMRFKLRDGRIAEVHSFFDTALVGAALQR